jgi:hypothetical protein
VVDAAELEVAFAVTDKAALAATVTGVSGVVPAGKTLVVVKGAPEVTASATLTVEGTLEIQEGAELNASGSSVGHLAAGPASITGTGVLVLPYAAAAGYASYGTVSYAGKAAAGLNVAGIEAIFGAEGGPSALTVYDLEDITNAAVPKDKTLTLVGAGNTVTAALDLSTDKGTLVVAKGATLTADVANAISANATTSNVRIEGVLDLDEDGTLSGKVTNNGVIASATTTNTVQAWLITTPTGTGKVVLSGEGSTALTAAAALTQDVEISGSGSKLIAPAVATPFSGDKTITIATDGTLDFGAAVAGLSLSGVTIKNGGTIETETVSVPALNAILAVGGAVDSTGAVAGNEALTVPFGTTLTHTTGTFAGGTGEVVINGTATFTAGTFASLTGTAGETILEVGPGGNVTVGADGELTVAAQASLTIAAGSTLTVADGGAIVLVGHGTPAKLVLAPASGSAAKGGGGKLALTGSSGALGDIQVAQAGTADNLTATGTVKNFIFAGTATETGITSLDNDTGAGFTSIEAATSGDTDGTVTFKGPGAGSTATFDKASTLQGTSD